MPDDKPNAEPRPSGRLARTQSVQDLPDPPLGDAHPRLDFGWWASNGPTGGYLASLALDRACEETDLDPTAARSVELSVLRLAAADTYVTDVSVAAGPTRIALATVTFSQDEPFAQASVYFSPSVGGSIPGDCEPPGALPPEAYAELASNSLHGPPVMSQFVYRPTTDPDGQSPKPGWDLVWVRPVQPMSGRANVARLVDNWYPPNHTRAVRNYLTGHAELAEPPTVSLLGASIVFPAPEDAYRNVSFVLVANQLDIVTNGHYFEQTEVWSEHGDLLIAARLLRRNQTTGGDRSAPGVS